MASSADVTLTEVEAPASTTGDSQRQQQGEEKSEQFCYRGQVISKVHHTHTVAQQRRAAAKQAQVIVRFACDDDDEDLSEMFRRCETPIGGVLPRAAEFATREEVHSWMRQMKRSGTRCLVLELGDQVLGVATITQIDQASIAPVVFIIEAPDEHVGKFFSEILKLARQWQQRVILLETAPERWLQILGGKTRLPDVDGRYQYRVLVPGAATSG